MEDKQVIRDEDRPCANCGLAIGVAMVHDAPISPWVEFLTSDQVTARVFFCDFTCAFMGGRRCSAVPIQADATPVVVVAACNARQLREVFPGASLEIE